MSEEIRTPTDPRNLLSLKLLEAEVYSDKPWRDDKLGREEIARRLTYIVIGQTSPLVVSLHGAWGTGKTFMLKRWQKELEGKHKADGPKHKAIYFNAWEEDFCDDPLLTIVGQLSEYFDNSSFMDGAMEVGRVAVLLLMRNLKGVTNRFTGVPFDIEGTENKDQELVTEYLALHAAKDDFKDKLAKLSAKVLEETGHPLVFIIDELDRCRPTFAIELLERVKHIFDVPNIVFVLGINRDELCNSLKAVYGEIEADTYLRRFFDLGFNLPAVNSTEFTIHLLQQYGITEYSSAIKEGTEDSILSWDLPSLEEWIPQLWEGLGLCLRDIDHCVRVTALVAMELPPKSYLYPHLLGVLIALKISNTHLFHEFVRGYCRGSEVMDYIGEFIPTPTSHSDLYSAMASLECLLYYADYRGIDDPFGDVSAQVPALAQLRLLKKGEPLTEPQYLSQSTQSEPKDDGKIHYLITRLEVLCAPKVEDAPRNIVRYLANKVDLGGGLLRR